MSVLKGTYEVYKYAQNTLPKGDKPNLTGKTGYERR